MLAGIGLLFALDAQTFVQVRSNRRVNCDLFLCAVCGNAILYLDICCCACNVHASFIRTPMRTQYMPQCILCQKERKNRHELKKKETKLERQENETEENATSVRLKPHDKNVKCYGFFILPVYGRNHMIKILFFFFRGMFAAGCKCYCFLHVKAATNSFSSNCKQRFIILSNVKCADKSPLREEQLKKG